MASTKVSQPSAQVTQKDVARRAGVALSSVSYVINNGPRPVSEETRARVLKAIDELGYRPNEHARRLIQRNWGTEPSPRQFGILLFGGPRVLIARPYYSTLIVGLYDEAVRQNYAVRFVHLSEEIRNPLLFNETIHRESIAGVVLLQVAPLDRTYRDLLERVIERIGNVICLDTFFPNLPSITFDHLGAGRLATDHLLGLGHQRIGYIGNRDGRFDGYLQSLRLHGLTFEPGLATSEKITDQDEVTNSLEGGWLGANQLLSLPELPTAIFCASDEVAIGALRAAREHGLRVPDDLSIVSVDDIELARYTSPPLTTVRVPQADMAGLTVRTLIERVSSPNAMPVNMVLPVTLQQRGSTGPNPQR
ncbi:MAG: LacI family transcriptional regulator [Chloroflexaceae bacterium]|jgi:DNA-binding LacI/PurR family transcriptional regulator|nr:LacI family transcriptional regulator [Chloroflexaceae bacterium]